MVKVKTGARMFPSVRRDSAHGDLDGAIVVGVCSDGLPEMFVAGASVPDEVIATLKKLEGYIFERCSREPDGRLR